MSVHEWCMFCGEKLADSVDDNSCSCGVPSDSPSLWPEEEDDDGEE